jgi:hypothetical protein
MAAAQVPGNPNPSTETPVVATEATPSAVVETGDPINDALAGFNPDEPATPGGTPDKAAEAKPEPDKKPEAEKPAKRTRKEVEEALFSDTALATPEGVTKARDYLGRRRSKLDGIDIRLTERAGELDQREQTINAAYEAASAELEQDRSRARVIAQIDDTLRNGSIEQMLETLGALRGVSGIEVWKAMSKVAIEGKLPAGAPPEVVELRKKVQTLSERLEQREQGAETAEVTRIEGEVKRLESDLVSAASDPSKYPELARYVKLGLGENIVAEVVKQKTAARAKGTKLDNAGALAQIERELSRLSPAGASPARSEVAGRSASAPAGASPVSPAAAIADDVPITGIAPSQTRSTGVTREKTQAELDEDLAKDTAYLSQVLGIDLSI